MGGCDEALHLSRDGTDPRAASSVYFAIRATISGHAYATVIPRSPDEGLITR
jgi:hypothetical protein